MLRLSAIIFVFTCKIMNNFRMHEVFKIPFISLKIMPPPCSMASFSREPTFMSEKPRRRKARNQPVTTEQLLFSTGDNEASPYVHANDIDQLTREEFPVHLHGSPTKTDEKSLSYIVLPAANKYHNGNSSLQSAVPYTDEIPSTLGFKPIIANNGKQSSYLVCSHIVEGHDQAVLCVECTDDVLFSSSEDGYIRIWDLATNAEIQEMNHISAVRKVCYCEYTRRAFTASASAVKVWDVRQNPASIVHTFWASGKLERMKDTTLGPDDEINDISLNQYGTLLYAASTRSVQIFDLRMLQCIGALDVGYKSNVLCLAVNDLEFQKNRIVCGTSDKALKVFETREDDFGIRKPKCSLSPLHEDAIQALALYDNTLLSASRDKSLRRWNLDTKQAEYVIHNAHNDWICALNMLQDRNEFVTGCKSGYLKLWTTGSFRKLEEIKGHQSSINSITSNNSLVFTASNDCNIGVWKLKDAGSQGLQILS